HTDDLRDVADRHGTALATLDGYVLKNKSPSCGLYGLPVFAGGRRVDGQSRGAFAARLVELLPDLPVEEQGRLSDPGLREHFVERVFAHARLRALFTAADADEGGAAGGSPGTGWRPRDLVAFHARHKLQLMAHSPEGYRATGRIVSQAGVRPPEEVRRDYTAAFTRALALRATVGRNANALQHAFGMVSDQLDDARRRDLLDVVDRYREGLVPLSVPVALIRHHCEAENVTWARKQTYLAPFPADLRLRNAMAPS
ncbi:YbgA family protein, partial [Streptomonospora algeriensis]